MKLKLDPLLWVELFFAVTMLFFVFTTLFFALTVLLKRTTDCSSAVSKTYIAVIKSGVKVFDNQKDFEAAILQFINVQRNEQSKKAPQ